MGYPTPIEWTDATWNPVAGCSIKSAGCAPCYAQRLAGTRLAHHPLYAGTTDIVKGKPVFNGTLTAAPEGHPVWDWPLTWRGAKEPLLGPGMPSTIFVGDMSDLFHERRSREHIDRVIYVAAKLASRADPARQHILQLLTKRPDVMADYWAELFGGRLVLGFVSIQGAPDSVWVGMSAERQPEFDARWPHLRRLAEMGFVVFVSYEPALGPLSLPADFLALGPRAQLIAGGVSGREADQPPHPDWFRSVRDQCAPAGVAFHFKQWGEWAPMEAFGATQEGPVTDAHGNVRNWMRRYVVCGDDRADRLDAHSFTGHGTDLVYRVGKARAGRLLDGREHNAMPAVRRG